MRKREAHADGTWHAPVSIALSYLLLGTAWIVLSDWVVSALFGLSELTLQAQLAKGLLFVAGSGLIIYVLVERLYRSITRREDTIRDDRDEIRELKSEVHQSEQRLRVILSNITETVLLTDDDGCFTYVCPNVSYIFGYDAESVRGMGTVDALLGDGFDPDDFDDDGLIENVEREVKDAEGDTHTVLVTVKSVPLEAGSMLYSIRDVSARKAQEERFQAYVENSSDVITVVDERGTIEYVSPSVQHVLGYAPEELVGRDPFELVHPDDREDLTRRFETIESRPPGSTISVEYRTRAADGSWLWTESRVTTHREQVDGAYVINTHDVSDLREREGRLSVLDRVLRHNLRNKLNVILGNAKALDGQVGPEAQSKVEALVDAGEELLRLGEKARRFNVSIRRRDAELERVDLVACARSVVDEVRVERPGVTVSVDAPSEAWVSAHEALGLAITELAENAVLHSRRDDPTIEIEVAVRDATVGFRMADDGVGLSDVDRRVILEGEEKPLEHGLGLGLWLVRWTVENSGGSLDVRDNEPTGTVIEIELPRATPDGADDANGDERYV